jgi:Phosphopantetheine attachment site.
VDSIIGAELTSEIGTKLGIDINTSVLYEYTSVARFTKYLMKNSRRNPTITQKLQKNE